MPLYTMSFEPRRSSFKNFLKRFLFFMSVVGVMTLWACADAISSDDSFAMVRLGTPPNASLLGGKTGFYVARTYSVSLKLDDTTLSLENGDDPIPVETFSDYVPVLIKDRYLIDFKVETAFPTGKDEYILIYPNDPEIPDEEEIIEPFEGGFREIPRKVADLKAANLARESDPIRGSLSVAQLLFEKDQKYTLLFESTARPQVERKRHITNVLTVRFYTRKDEEN